MKEYKKRVADQILSNKLVSSGAVLIEGPKYCGKTRLASQQAGSILSQWNAPSTAARSSPRNHDGGLQKRTSPCAGGVLYQ